jgi:phosphoglycerate-specific signal transduction histidine kinase
VVGEAVAQTVVATAEPVVAGAQQALFLTEDALIMSANGSLSGIIVLAATLALITLIGSAAFHYNAYGKKGFTLKGIGLV